MGEFEPPTASTQAKVNNTHSKLNVPIYFDAFSFIGREPNGFFEFPVRNWFSWKYTALCFESSVLFLTLPDGLS